MKNKITFIISSSEVGGAQKWVLDQIDLLANRFDIILITNKPGWLSDSCKSNASCYFVNGLDRITSFFCVFSILKILISKDVGLVICSSASAGLYARLATCLLRGKVIYVSHGWSCLYNGGGLKMVFCFVEKLLSYLTDKIVCVSYADAELAKTKLGIAASKIYILPNKVFIRKTRPKIFKSSKPLKLLFVGRLTHPKRLDILLDSIRLLDMVHLTVVGDGDCRKNLRPMGNVSFLGEVKNFNDFSRYDLFVLVSDSEGLPMSAIEAAASGIPLLLSDVGGCSELIDKEFANGVLVNNSSNEISEAIKKINTDYDYYFRNAKKSSYKYNILNFKNDYIMFYNNTGSWQ